MHLILCVYMLKKANLSFEKILFLFLVIFAFYIRIYNINWDNGFHLHPDERAIVMYAIPLKIPLTITELLKPDSSLNPHFFAYGNFPLYLLKSVSLLVGMLDPTFASYERINILGRFLSVIAEIGTLLFIYLIARKIFNKTVALASAFIYAFSVFPIQASHFYAVDVLLTFFITCTIFQLLKFYEKPSIRNSIFVGVFFGLSLVTKISAAPLIAAITFTIAADFILVFLKSPHKFEIWFPHLPILFKKLIKDGFVIFSATALTFIILQPYALIDFQEFINQNVLQSQMTKNAFIFPYTLQYVGKIPYFYEIKNLFWGQGPIISLLSILGTLYFIFLVFKKEEKGKDAKQIILFVFFAVYFLIIGKFAVGWMRYMLPLYPLLSIFTGVLIYKFLTFIKLQLNYWYLFVVLVFICSILVWPLSFLNIYSRPNTRVTVSNFINKNIKPGQTIALEHWDDSLPLYGQEKYKVLTLELYNPDTSEKWRVINEQLKKTDYIIIASNRLYTPLQKLTDCKNLPQDFCYPLTAQYYKNLFSGKLGFEKIAEFTSYPKIPFTNFGINDQSADESFTVYDHPKIMIFKKSSL